MTEISYGTVLIFITAVWLAMRTAAAIKNKKIEIKHELKLLLFYCYLALMALIVYFPLNGGKIGTMKFDAGRILPFLINPLPFVHLFDPYAGWLRNLIGNIVLFIPVGIIWPLCFKKMDNIFKVVAAGLGFSLFIELSQLLLYERTTDTDDLILNTLGALIGAVIYFIVRAIVRKRKNRVERLENQ